MGEESLWSNCPIQMVKWWIVVSSLEIWMKPIIITILAVLVYKLVRFQGRLRPLRKGVIELLMSFSFEIEHCFFLFLFC